MKIVNDFDLKYLNTLEEIYRKYVLEIQNKSYVTERKYINYKDNSICYSKTGYGISNVFGMRVYPSNSSKDTQSENHITLVYDTNNANLKFIAIGEKFAAIRNAFGTRLFVEKSVLSEINIGIVGLGTQGFFHALVVSEMPKVHSVYIYIRDFKKHKKQIGFLKRKYKSKIKFTTDFKELQVNCKFLVTTTNSDSPICNIELLESFKFISNIGNKRKGKNELPVNIYNSYDVIIDNIVQYQALKNELVFSNLKVRSLFDVEKIKNKTIFVSLGLNGMEVTIANWYYDLINNL